jgi:hypothetical protein
MYTAYFTLQRSSLILVLLQSLKDYTVPVLVSCYTDCKPVPEVAEVIRLLEICWLPVLVQKEFLRK